MDRRNFIKTISAAGTYLTFSSLEVFSAKEKKQNILFIISDDQSWLHNSYLGCKELHTPGFDKIASNGILFENSFCVAPSCAPSRASILTGQEGYRLGEAGVHFSNFPLSLPVFTRILENNGYSVGHTGKGWAPGEWKKMGWENNPVGKAFNQIKMNGEIPSGISTIDYAGNFENFINETSDQPFFFWLGCYEPHRYYNKGLGKESGKNIDNIQVPEFLPDNDVVKSDIADYYHEIEWFDKHIERSYNILENKGLLEDTLIVVTSDNGMPFPRAKANLYDYGTRMPFAICWGNKILGKGERSNALVSFTDLAPTFLTVAGIQIPDSMTGKSLVPLLNNKNKSNKDFVVSMKERHSWCQPNGAAYVMRSLRTKKYLLIHNMRSILYPSGHPNYIYNHDLKPFGDVDTSPTKTFLLENKNNEDVKYYYEIAFEKRPQYELYDVELDPAQLNNLAEKDNYQEILDNLKTMLHDYLVKTGDPRIIGGDEVFDNAPYYSSRGIETEGMNWQDYQRRISR